MFGGGKPEESAVTFASVVGKIDKFNANEDVEEWFITFDAFLEVNDVKKDSKKALQWLLVWSGKHLSRIFHSVKASVGPNDWSYEVAKKKIVALVKGAAKPEIARQVFYERRQKAGELVAEFTLALKELASVCDFGSHLDVISKDQFMYSNIF